MKANTTFWELIKKYSINIPIIQRDYAQGRIEEKEKRDKFLNSIYIHLKGNENPLDLDFVYGKIENSIFYPIDGQQRLTTLFLLHWYVSIKENISSKKELQKFVYDTRISSREFCESIIKEEIIIPKKGSNDNFIQEIQDKHWFRPLWKKDPTIKAMLVMIQAIHEKFSVFSENTLWTKLTETRIITFQTLDLGEKGFELTDELYIKMNARGKQLTNFENFKANFIQFLDKAFKDKTLKHPIKGTITFAGYFSYKIEKEWTDLFWSFRNGKEVIDDMFLNFFEFISQMCYFKNNRNAKAEDFNNDYEQIFANQENILFLFNSLDKLHEISSDNGISKKENIQKFFNLLLNNDNKSIKLFWNGENNFDLFSMIITTGLKEDARNKIVFYSILHYLLKFKTLEPIKNLNNYIRVIRNLLQARRQKKETKYNTNVRINEFGKYWQLFNQLATENVYSKLKDNSLNNEKTFISDKSIENEKNKALLIDNNSEKTIFNLENFKYFEGLIHILDVEKNKNKLANYFDAITEIWSKDISDTLRIQALITCGFEGLYIKNCRMGEMWYFGKKGNWTTILSTENQEISQHIISLLDNYLTLPENKIKEKLKFIVNDWLNKNVNNRSWKYYFLKYSNFITGRNYYAWRNEFEIRMLGSVGLNPLLAYHISPYVLTVCRQINDKTICDENNCYQQYTGNSPLILENGITLTCSETGWIIKTDGKSIKSEMINKYKLNQTNDNFILTEFDNRDRIELAVDFVKDIK